MDDDKRILVFSDAGGTGRSYHADLACRNQRQRIHYLLEPGWRADAAIQGLGRSNRTNQKQPPVFRPVATDVKGEKRFLSTIARRLDTLGAITRGQRQTGGQGLFRADDNLESAYAKRRAAPVLSAAPCRQDRGLLARRRSRTRPASISSDQDGSLREELPPITQFLNRVLALRIDLQNTLFAAFEQLLEARIEAAIAAGTYDLGVETLIAESFRVVERRTRLHLCRHRRRNPLLPRPAQATATGRCRWPTRSRCAATPGAGLLVNEQSHRAAVQVPASSLMHDDGSVEPRTRLVRPMARETITLDAIRRIALARGDRERIRGAVGSRMRRSVPEFSESSFHIITGLLLPIWDRLPADDMRVYRFETDDGERVIGRLVAPEALGPLYQALGVDARPAFRLTKPGARCSTAAPCSISPAGCRSAALADAWARTASSSPASPTAPVAALKALGLISEIIAWRLRLFVPDGRRPGPAILAALLERHPLLARQSPRRAA